MKKVLIISQLPPPENGSTKMTKMLDFAMTEMKIETRIISKNFSSSTSEIGKKYWKKIFVVPRLLVLLLKELSNKPDAAILFVTSRFPSILIDLLMISICRLSGTKVLLYLHTFGFAKLRFTKRLTGRWMEWAFSETNSVVLGESMKSEVTLVNSSTQVNVIRNTTGKTSSNVGPKQTDEHLERKSISFVSNLVDSKGLDTFLEVFAKLSESHPNLTANIVGQESFSNQISQIQSTLDPQIANRVYFWGSQNGIFIRKILMESVFLLHPTREDAQPLVILESISCGTPVVSSKVGTIPEMLRRTPELAINPWEIGKFVTECDFLLNDSNHWNQVTKLQIEVLNENYSYEAFRDSWTRLLQEICKKPKTISEEMPQ